MAEEVHGTGAHVVSSSVRAARDVETLFSDLVDRDVDRDIAIVGGPAVGRSTFQVRAAKVRRWFVLAHGAWALAWAHTGRTRRGHQRRRSPRRTCTSRALTLTIFGEPSVAVGIKPRRHVYRNVMSCPIAMACTVVGKVGQSELGPNVAPSHHIVLGRLTDEVRLEDIPILLYLNRIYAWRDENVGVQRSTEEKRKARMCECRSLGDVLSRSADLVGQLERSPAGVPR